MKADSLQKWALYAEVLGGIAVVVTLIFLMFEIRSNTNELRLTQIRDAILNNQESTAYLRDNSDLYLKSLENPGDLSDAEIMKLGYVVGSRVTNLRTLHEGYLRGAVPQEEWERWRDTVPQWFGDPLGRAFWDVERKSWLAIGLTDFVSEVDFALQNSSVSDERAWIQDVKNSLEESIDQ